MLFTYTASVILVALAMFGSWYLLKDVWSWLVRPHIIGVASVSFLVVVKDVEQDIEMMVRHLVKHMEQADGVCDAVVVDCSSEDLTSDILARLAVELPGLTVCRAPSSVAAAAAAIPLCRGSVIHVLDTIHRLNCSAFMITVCRLLEQDSFEIAVRQRY